MRRGAPPSFPWKSVKSEIDVIVCRRPGSGSPAAPSLVGGCDQFHTRTASIFRSDTLWTQGHMWRLWGHPAAKRRENSWNNSGSWTYELRNIHMDRKFFSLYSYLHVCVIDIFNYLRVWASQKIVWWLTLFQSRITRFRIRKVWYKIQIMKKKSNSMTQYKLKVDPSGQGSRTIL